MTAYYYQCSIGALMDFLSETLYEETCNADYLMIDEACELVAVKDKEANKSLKKKYLWAFFSRMKKLVSYVYEQESRCRDVVLKFLKNFCGCISTDAYVAYSIFDDAKNIPILCILRVEHMPGDYLLMLKTDKINCDAVINDIGELFGIE